MWTTSIRCCCSADRGIVAHPSRVRERDSKSSVLPTRPPSLPRSRAVSVSPVSWSIGSDATAASMGNHLHSATTMGKAAEANQVRSSSQPIDESNVETPHHPSDVS